MRIYTTNVCHAPAMLFCDVSNVTSAGVDHALTASMPSSWFLLTFRYTRPSDWMKALGIFPVNLLLEKSACRSSQCEDMCGESSHYGNPNVHKHAGDQQEAMLRIMPPAMQQVCTTPAAALIDGR
jgi:hypothetical protein